MIETIRELYGYIDTLFAGTLNRLLVAVIILLIGFIIGKVANRILERGLTKIRLNEMVKQVTGLNFGLEEMIGHFVMYFIYFIAIIMSLRHLGIATDILNILSAVIIVLIGIFILLGVKDFIPNIISGIILNQKGTIKKGDEITVQNVKGKVIEITLLETRLETKKGDLIIIPNANLTKNEIIMKKQKK
jgi:small conductance mechanosensitive channel